MAFEWQILRRRPWTGHLVEDAEFQLEMLLDDDIVVAYVPHARLVAEMPSTLQGSTSQNARWERGRLELVTHYTPRLARDLLRGGVRRRIARADAIADLVLPPLSVLAAAQVLTTALNIGVALSGSSRARTRVLIDVGGVLAVTAGPPTGASRECREWSYGRFGCGSPCSNRRPTWTGNGPSATPTSQPIDRRSPGARRETPCTAVWCANR
jgi:hypothetical protein